MITLSSIEKSFDGSRVLKNINLTIEEGTVTTLIGPSGSGKSTLLRCINLLEIPQSGELTIGKERIAFAPDTRIKGQDIRRISRQTGMVFQNFALFPHMTALDNITEGLITVHKWDRERARRRGEELLDKVGMLHKCNALPNTLSGGQQQRVAIARALAPSPAGLLTHDLRLAANIASQGVFLEAGEIVESGSANDLFLHAKRPRTAEFIASLSTALP